jgi:two-component system NtrC family sensor kinase
MAMQIDWVQVVQLSPFRSLQTKATLLVIAIVAGVLALSTVLNIQVSERALERDLRDNAMALARQFAAGIGSWEELNSRATLEVEIRQVMNSRSGIARVEVYAIVQGGASFIISSDDAIPPASPSPEVSQAAREDRPVAVLHRSTRGRQWDVAVPVHLHGVIAGVVRLQVSLAEADQLAAQERWQAMLIMGASTAAIVLLMSLFLRQTLHRHLQNLVTTMARAETGDLDAEARIHTEDELGRLAGSFNRMLRRIRNFNGELQEKVAQATAELRELNEKLFETRREMGRLERLAAVGEVAAMVAHEVGTPLTAVSGHLQLLAEEVQDPCRVKERLSVIDAQVGRAIATIQGFLDSARFPAPLQRPILVNALVQEVLTLASPGISRHRGMQVVTDFSPELPAIMADGDQLRQVLLNLVTNALDAMPEGGQLSVRTQAVCNADVLAAVQIGITDTGVGIRSDDLRHIFDPFFTTKGPGHGTGLGLVICQRIVKAHQGSIEVQSEMGQGTTFLITLPVEGSYACQRERAAHRR